MNEYYTLKEEATKRCAAVEMELERLVQARITDNNALQCERRRLVQAKERVKNVGLRFFWFVEFSVVLFMVLMTYRKNMRSNRM